jgi:NADPH:quinone reductase-like Zn-dependent oxidoreductase
VDAVVEVGGEKTLPQSLTAARVGGTVVIIGVLSGYSENIMIPVLFSKNLRLIGISVGSRAEFADMAAAIGKWKLKPVIDRTYPLEDLPAALERMQAGAHFGKICLAV